jgi:hypothetical protein
MDVADILSELNDHGFEDTASSRKVSILNDTVADVCSREPWPFLEKEITLTFNGSSAVPTNWPSDFSKEVGVNSPAGYKLTWERWDALRERYATDLAATGAPRHFYFVKNQLKAYPIPASTDTLNMEYICWHPELSETSVEADILIPARHHRVLVVGTLTKLYAMEDDPELSQLFQGMYQERLRMMREDLMRVQYAPDSILVFDDDLDGYYL